MSSKIHATHLQRRAVVYLRQSTLKQVYEHKESTHRQYALRQRALTLGWLAERVDVVDEDLGQSGTTTHGRTGFQRVAEDVARGQVGAIFALEVSRLARSSADWHRLLELCGLADVVIVDEQAVYAPQDYNDRLLLGLKGTMSEAEQYWMRLRLQGGKLSKARRGELRVPAPLGYQWDGPGARFRFDADAQVQAAVRLAFERFRIDGSAYAVMRYFARHGLKLPVRNLGSDELRWVLPRYSLFRGMFHNPTYAGAYVFGRHEERLALVNGQVRRRRVKRLAQDDWKVVLRDRHPAYITWDEYLANQRKLAENAAPRDAEVHRGAAREGAALLQGLALCGRCGHRMSPNYQGPRSRAQYECRSLTKKTGRSEMCWSVSADSIDRAVAELFLSTVTPPEMDLAVAVTHEVNKQANALDQQWKLSLDRAHYEAHLAERRYKAVDPDNRVVAQTLEREWNEKLRAIEDLERDRHAAQQRSRANLTDADRARLRTLARDLRRVWSAATTSQAERKTLLRLAIREVALSPIEVPDRETRVQVLWQTGTVTELRVPRPTRERAMATAPAALCALRDLLAQDRSDDDIAAHLNAAGWQTGRHRPWDQKAVKWARSRYQLQRPHAVPANLPLPDRRDDGLYSVRGVAHRLCVTTHIVHDWISRGILHGIGGGPGRPWWFKLDATTIRQLKQVRDRGYGPRTPQHSETSY